MLQCHTAGCLISPRTHLKQRQKIEQKDTNMFNINAQWRHHMHHAPPSFSWQMVTPIIVGWFVGCMWKNNSKWYF
jgi:hypothetical protein